MTPLLVQHLGRVSQANVQLHWATACTKIPLKRGDPSPLLSQKYIPAPLPPPIPLPQRKHKHDKSGKHKRKRARVASTVCTAAPATPAPAPVGPVATPPVGPANPSQPSRYRSTPSSCGPLPPVQWHGNACPSRSGHLQGMLYGVAFGCGVAPCRVHPPVGCLVALGRAATGSGLVCLQLDWQGPLSLSVGLEVRTGGGFGCRVDMGHLYFYPCVPGKRMRLSCRSRQPPSEGPEGAGPWHRQHADIGIGGACIHLLRVRLCAGVPAPFHCPL